MPCRVTAACSRALPSGWISRAAQLPRCPRSCHSSATMPQPEHRSAAFWLRFGSQKRASSSASEPNRWAGVQKTSVLLYKTSVECSIERVPFPLKKKCGFFLTNLCTNKKQQTRFNRSAAFDAFLQQCHWLFSSDCTSGASTLASAAIDAGICIHNCNTVLDGDSTNRASALASAAANTCVRNLVCHNKLSFLSPCPYCYEETCSGTAVHATPEIVSLPAF